MFFMTIYRDIIMMILLISLIALVNIGKSVYAQDEEIFRVQIGLFGINNTDSSDDLGAAFVTINDAAKSRIINTTELDSEDSNGLDGIVESVPFSFPNTTVNIGQEVKSCFFIYQTLNAFCDTGYNSPLNRVELMSILLEEGVEDRN